MGRTIPNLHSTSTKLTNRLIIKLESLLTESLKSCFEDFNQFPSHSSILNRFTKADQWNLDNFLIGLESQSNSNSKFLMDRWVRNIVLSSATHQQSTINRPSSESTHQPPNSLFAHLAHSDQIPESLQWSQPVPPPIGSSLSNSSYNPLSNQETHPHLPTSSELGQSDPSLWLADTAFRNHNPSLYHQGDHLQGFRSSYTRHILSSVQGDFDRFIERMYQQPRPTESQSIPNATATTTTTTTTDLQDHQSRTESGPSTDSPPSLGLDPPVPVRTQRISLTLPGVRSILSAASPQPLEHYLSRTNHSSSPPPGLTEFSLFPDTLGSRPYPSQLTESDILHMERSNLYRNEDEDQHIDLHPSFSDGQGPRFDFRALSSHQHSVDLQTTLDETVPHFNVTSATTVTPDTPSQIDHIADSVQVSPSSDELHITLDENMDNFDSGTSERPSQSLTSDFDNHTTRARATSRTTRVRSQHGRSLSPEHITPQSEENLSTTHEGTQRRRKRSRTAPLVSQDLPFADTSSSQASTSNAAPTTADLAEEAARNSNPHRALPAFYSQDPQILTPEMTISIDTDPMTRRQIILDHSTHGPIRWHNASQKAIYEASKDGLVGEEIGQIRFSYLSIPPRERQRDRSTTESSPPVENLDESSTSRYLRSFYLTNGEWGPPSSSTSFRESLDIRPTLFSWGRRPMGHDVPLPPPLPTSSSSLDPMGSNYIRHRLANRHHNSHGRLYRSSTFARLPPIINGSASSSGRRMRREEEEFMLPPLLPRPPPPPPTS